MSFYGDLHRKIKSRMNQNEIGTGRSHLIGLTFEEMAYILGSMQISHALNKALHAGSEDAKQWVMSKDNKRYREDGTVIEPLKEVQ